MCTFLSTLPKKSKTAGTAKKRNLELFMKPCPDDNGNPTWYRFRILNFDAKEGYDRDYPFIERYIHQIWKKNDKGFNVVDSEVVCPVTKWMPWDGDRYDCPICKFANQQYGALKESNWTDADAKKKNKTFSRKFQAIIPVYVVNDPNYEGNNGKFKVIVFTDKKFYNTFREMIEKQLLKTSVFNGVNAADVCIHMTTIPTKINEGQANEWVWNKREIDKIAWSKPYDLSAITKDAIDHFPFDETYYVTSTKEELDLFYKKHIKISNDDIVQEDIEVFAPEKTEDKPVTKTNAVVKTAVENENAKVEALPAGIDDLTTDPDELGLGVPESSKAGASAAIPPDPTADSESAVLNADALLAGIDIS